MFADRQEAGLRLAVLLLKEKNLKDAVIVSIPRGGVVVGCEVASVVSLKHYPMIVKKIAAADNPELALGATGSDGVVFWDSRLTDLILDKSEKKRLLRATIKTIKEREKSLKLPLPRVKGKIVFVVDDGVATGATAIAASLILRKLGSKEVILAVPVISKSTKSEISKYFDKIIAAELPQDFRAVGEFYQDFPQVEDDEVRKLLKRD